MNKITKLSTLGPLAIGLFITGCSSIDTQIPDTQIPVSVIPTAPVVTAAPVIAPPPKIINVPRPQPMAKPVQRMVKPIQRHRMAKPVQSHKMMNAAQRRMVKPTQRQVAY